MKDLLDFLREFNAQTIISMGVLVWYFTREVKRELKASIDKLDEDVRKMNSRTCRLEGTVYGKDVYSKVDD